MHTPDDDERFAEQTLLQAVENQLETGDPAATSAVLNKLTLVGYERQQALGMIAYVLADEIHRMLAEERPFDRDRYESLLRALPELPQDG